MTIQSAVGHDVPRVDGWPKVSGEAEYLADMALPNMAHVAVVRSPYPRARVTAIDPAPALAVPGVLAVLTPADVADLPPVRIFADSPPVQRILTATPQFAGDAVAAVVAETTAAARQGVLAVEVDYEPLPAVLTAAEARDGDIQLHPVAPGNRAGPPINISRGDVDAALAGCAHVFGDSFTTQRQCAQTIEPLACICDWTGDHLDVWTHLDSMFHFRDSLAEALAVDAEQVRIHPPEALGASFGLKNSLIAPLEPLAAVCSRTVGLPVKLALSPEESMSATVTRHPARIDLVTGVDDDGILRARSAEVLLDSGAYGWGYVVALSMVGKWASLYRTEHLRFSATSVYTNHVPGGAYRSVGTAQIHFAMESQLDDIARSLDIDPVELRRRNVTRVGDPLSFGTTIRSFGAEECLDRGAEAAGWVWSGSVEPVDGSTQLEAPGLIDPRAAPEPPHPATTSRRGATAPAAGSSEPSEPRPGPDPLGRSRGRGMAMGMHHAGLTGLTPIPEVSRCDVELEPDGTVSISLGVIDKGQGALTTLTLVAADELGLAPERIRLHNLGTAAVPLDFWGAEASRTTYVMGRAVADGARRLREAIRERLGVEPADATPEVIASASAAAGGRRSTEAGAGPGPERAGTTGPIAVEGCFAPSDSDPLPVTGAHFCEVEVDHATGLVRVLRYVAAQDVGRAINPLGCRGQVEGGLHHGIGYALLEELRHDEGTPLNPNFMGYKVLMAGDMPDIEVVLVEDPDPDGGPHGAKGVGTPVIPAIAPAVANAVRDAIGVRLRDLPMTPPRVLAALLASERAGGREIRPEPNVR